DNGGPTRELTSSNHPLRGGKGDLYEGGIRVPFLVQWKERLPAGREYAHPVLSTDLFATACAAAGVETPEKQRADSVNLLPYLRGDRDGSPHETPSWRMGTQAALRHGDWKLVRNTRGRESAFELYDLKEDLSEQRNLAEQRPEIVKQLSHRWQAVDRQMSPP